MDALLEVRELAVSYRHDHVLCCRAVQSVNFKLARGEVLGLMGESGCGKSTVALAILGLIERGRASVSGSVIFRGESLLALGNRSLEQIRGAAISMVYQEPGIALSPVLRVGAQIAEVVRAHRRWSWEKCREEAHAVLARVGLEPTSRIFAAYPHQLSGGQLQRVVLAQAIVCGPALVIADEPTASLDARSQASFIALLRDLKKRSGMAMLLISHTPEIQASLADRLMVMREGRIVEQGDFDVLYANPQDSYTRALLRRPSTGEDLEPMERRRLAHAQIPV